MAKSRPLPDLWIRAFTHFGADPLAVRTVVGAVRFGEPGVSHFFDKSGVYATAEPDPAFDEAGLGEPYASRLNQARYLSRFGAARLVALFYDAGGVLVTRDKFPTCTVQSWRLQSNGLITKGQSVNLLHANEQRDDDVAGRPTLYTVTNLNDFNGDGASLRILVAAEGLGFDQE